MRRLRASSPWILAIPLVLAAAMYARFFAGFWLGDDFGFLHQTWRAAADGELWSQTWKHFFVADSSGVVFYRPMMMASVALNEWIAGDNFAGWFALNLLIHLLNTVVVAMLITRLASACGRDGRIAGIVAAAFFALCPILAEGVFWVAARADAWVTLWTLLGFCAWASSAASPLRATILPVCLALALGFKESAAVFPLQMALVALAWPTRLSRAQLLALAAAAVLALLYLVVRAHFFGEFWRVYTRTAPAPHLGALWLAAGSIGQWWRGLTRYTPGGALAYVGLAACACALLAATARRGQRRLGAALLCAGAGLVVATLLSIDAMAPSGEGGRLGYTPIAWLALAIGVAAAPPLHDAASAETRYRRAGLVLLCFAIVAGAWVLQGELRTASSAQRSVREIVNASRGWAATRPGLTLLVIDDRYGPVVTTRNAQAWLLMPPIQPQPLLHRVLPTLPQDLDSRYDQLSAGLGSRLDKIRPSRLDADELGRLLEHDTARWPEWYACWSEPARGLVELAAPDPSDRTRWKQALLDNLRKCGAAES